MWTELNKQKKTLLARHAYSSFHYHTIEILEEVRNFV